jgi:hypothetical protein
MKSITLLLSAATFVGCFAVNSVAAAENKKQGKAAATVSDPMARFDQNANGVLEKKERDALREAFAKDASLKALDLNADGKLDESEINAVEVPPKARGGGKKKKTE